MTLLRLLLMVPVVLWLAGCATTTPRPQPRATLIMPPTLQAAAAVDVDTDPPDLWQQLRQGFAFADCDQARVQHWAAFYTRHPEVFTRELAKTLPRLRYIHGIIAEAGLPAEFALLPWVESNFRALPPRNRRGAAGVWQIMPATGRSLGLRIDHRYDGRLNLDEATRAAARLLQRNHERLGSWWLADLAFNAGAGRVSRAMDAHPQAVVSRQPAALGLPDVTVNHLAKLEALACIITNPAVWTATLPDPEDGPHLVHRRLDHGLDLPLAARLAGVDTSALQLFNEAVRDGQAPLTSLILPQQVATTFDDSYARLQQLGWQQWQYVAMNQPGSLAQITHGNATQMRTLATLNDLPADAALAAGQKLWLPRKMVAALPATIAVRDAHQPPRHYIVRAGDTLWTIARRFDLRIPDIRQWNGIKGDLLHLGQRLILQP